MKRRDFLRILIVGGSGLVLNKVVACKSPSGPKGSRALPPPQVNTFSSEIVLNTRRSYHGGYSGTLSEQILANVLWATAKVPLIGTSRIIYVALQDNVYEYDPDTHEITIHEPGNHLSESNLAFEVGIASDLAEDAGSALHYGHLAATSFWTSTSDQPTCCPKESAAQNANSTWNPASSIHCVDCYGRTSSVSGITDELVAQSSDASLPNPSTNGTVLLENALSHLKYGSQFLDTELTLNQISQIVWASYGCTPHLASYNRAGLTVASAAANYYLTGRVYIVRSEGVERYHNRLPSGQLTTRDHRIERVSDGDHRSQLRAAIPRLPQKAPAYYVYCLEAIDKWRSIEVGFCGASALLQVSSIDLLGFFTGDFNTTEQTAIITALSIPPTDLPLLIFSAGYEDTGTEEKSETNLRFHEARPNPFTNKTRIRYSLNSPAYVQLTIYDAAGRQIKGLVDQHQSQGGFSVIWNGTDASGAKLPTGSYYYILKIGAKEYKQKVIKA